LILVYQIPGFSGVSLIFQNFCFQQIGDVVS
jgi:hypothetical protein